MTENQDVPKTEEMNNLKNEIRQRNAVLIDQQTKRQIRDWLEGNPYQELLEYMKSRVMGQENIAIVVANVFSIHPVLSGRILSLFSNRKKEPSPVIPI